MHIDHNEYGTSCAWSSKNIIIYPDSFLASLLYDIILPVCEETFTKFHPTTSLPVDKIMWVEGNLTGDEYMFLQGEITPTIINNNNNTIIKK